MTDDLPKVHVATYAAAVAVLTLKKQRVLPSGEHTKLLNTQTEPAWRSRLLKDIDDLRAEADVIKYVDGIKSRKTARKIEGIFQGDFLSPVLFCIATDPLSRLLNSTDMDFRLRMKDNCRYNHLLYMDDLKLYAENKKHLQSLNEMTRSFSSSVRMNFGLGKCATIHIRKGRIDAAENIIFDFKSLEEEQTYRYLGIKQSLGIAHTALKGVFKEGYRFRLTKLLNSRLNSSNIFKAINSWAVPSLIYSFGVLKCSETDLN